MLPNRELNLSFATSFFQYFLHSYEVKNLVAVIFMDFVVLIFQNVFYSFYQSFSFSLFFIQILQWKSPTTHATYKMPKYFAHTN